MRARVYWAPVALYVLTAALFARATVADGYDGAGFVLAMQRLDLAHFQPQPPGYPLYVALGRLLCACGLPHAVALALVSAVLLGAGIAAVAAQLDRRMGRAAGLSCLLLLTFSPLCYALGIATLSDGAGLGALLLAVAALLADGAAAPWLGGALLGAALGIRPTYAPLAGLVLLAVGLRGGGRAMSRAGVGALGAVLLWLTPFALLIGPRTLFDLCRAHFSGHLTEFGGALTAEPAAGIPVVSLLRGLAEASLGPVWPLGLLLLSAALWSLRGIALPAAVRRQGSYLLLGLVGYLVFALVALPVRGHARHLLPAVVALLVLFSLILGYALTTAGDRLRLCLTVACGLLIVSLAGSSLRAIGAFRQPAPGPALAQYVTTHHPPGTLLYGARAARFVDLIWGSGSAHPTTQFGDVLSDVERLDRLPAQVLCTSEVRASASTLSRLRPLARFCYPTQLPHTLRFDPYPDGCVELLGYRLR